MKQASRRKKEEEANDQDWIFSYADLMSLLLCFFILLFAISVLDPTTARKISEKIEERFSASDKLAIPEVQLRDIPAERQARAFQLLVKMLNLEVQDADAVSLVEQKYADRAFVESIQEKLDEDIKKSAVVSHSNEVEFIFRDKILFGPGSKILSQDAKKTLDSWVRDVFKVLPTADITVVGYADKDVFSGDMLDARNVNLSFDRAMSVRAYLVNRGVPPQQISVRSFGGQDDLALQKKENRQVVLQLKRRF